MMQMFCDEKGFIWSERLKFGSVNQADSGDTVDRPVSKVIILLESEDVDENMLKSLPRELWIKCIMISRYHVFWRGAMY